MAIISGIQYFISVSGNGYVSDFYDINTFLPTSKREMLYDNITNNNGEIPITLIGMNTITTIFAKSSQAKISLYTPSGIVDVLHIAGMALYEIDPIVAVNITSGSVSTIDTVGISASITLIGYV